MCPGPISIGSVLTDPSFNGWKLTLVDALDTMWIMGLEKEFYDAVTQVAELDFELKEVRCLLLVLSCSTIHLGTRVLSPPSSRALSVTLAACSPHMRSPESLCY